MCQNPRGMHQHLAHFSQEGAVPNCDFRRFQSKVRAQKEQKKKKKKKKGSDTTSRAGTGI